MSNIIPLALMTLVALGEGAAIVLVVSFFLKTIRSLTEEIGRTETERLRLRDNVEFSKAESPRQKKMNEWKYGKKE